MDQRIIWDAFHLNPAEIPTPIFGNDSTIIDLDSDDLGDFSFWENNLASPGRQIETERGHSWASPLLISDRSEERQMEPNNMTSGSRTDNELSEIVNLNLNSSLSGAGQSFPLDSSFAQNSISYIPFSTETVNLPSPISFSNPSRSSRVEGSSRSSFDGRRSSFKRKNIEPSGSSSSCLYQSDNNMVHGSTPLSIASSSNYPLGITLNEELNPRNGTSDGYNVTERGESSQRNCRSRISPACNQWVPGNGFRSSSDIWTFQASNLVPFDQSAGASSSQPCSLPVPPVQYDRSFSPITAPSSRPSSFLGPALENPAIIHPTWVNQQTHLSTRSWAQAPSQSQAVSSPYVFQSPRPAWIPHPTSDTIHSSLTPGGGPMSGQTINGVASQPSPLPSNLQEMGYRYALSRRSLQQHGLPATSVQGAPVSLPSVGAARERRRVLSEIRNAFMHASRGEHAQFEDAFFDHAVFLGGHSDFHDRHRDMRLDVDNMSYEELLALEERIGNVNTGLSEEKILKRMKQRKYISLTAEPSEMEPCCICQEEYMEEEDVGRLNCGHDFHTACIKQWLMSKNLCPICKTTGIAT